MAAVFGDGPDSRWSDVLPESLAQIDEDDIPFLRTHASITTTHAGLRDTGAEEIPRLLPVDGCGIGLGEFDGTGHQHERLLATVNASLAQVGTRLHEGSLELQLTTAESARAAASALAVVREALRPEAEA